MTDYRCGSPSTRAHVLITALATGVSILLTACGNAPAERPLRPTGDRQQTSQPEAAEQHSGFAEISERSPRGAAMPPGFEDGQWADVLREADGRTVDWYLWGGDQRIDQWVRSYVVDLAAGRYGINVNVVPVADTADAVATVLGEHAAGRDEDGAVDLIWINGENFRSLREADALYGPWTAAAPSSRYVDLNAPINASDFGVPVDGFELPWGRSHFVMIYDTARISVLVSDSDSDPDHDSDSDGDLDSDPDADPEPGLDSNEGPLNSIDDLFEYARANPGTVTYPAPPDFTGSAFVRLVCLDTLGLEALDDAPDALDPAVLKPCADKLREITPFLWREGQTYPTSVAQLDDLFADGEIDFSMSFNPASASQRIEEERFTDTTRTFVFDRGTLANSHFLAIPYNAADPSAAMVLANFLLSPEAQFGKAQPSVWGDFTVLELDRLEPIWADTFEGLTMGPATLPAEFLATKRLEEPATEWIEAIETMWHTEVLAP